MKPVHARRLAAPALLAFAGATVLATAVERPPMNPASATQRPADDRRQAIDQDELHHDEPGGIEFRWPARVATLFDTLDTPVLTLRLINHDAVAYEIRGGTLEDAGSLQTRRPGEPFTATLPARGSIELPIRFGADLPPTLTHSGMLVALVTACPAAGGRCVTGASDPLFFHPDRGGLLVYGERMLCERFQCGALSERIADREGGTWRVLGGGPLRGVAADEEADTGDEDDRIVNGGER